MKTNKKTAYTLAEVLICLVLVGFLFTLTSSNLRTDNFNRKARLANLYKAVSAVQEASAKIRDLEPEICPTGSFIEKIGVEDSDATVAILDSTGAALTSQKIAEIFGKWIKFEIKDIDYCTYSKFCLGGTQAAADAEQAAAEATEKGETPTPPTPTTTSSIYGGRIAGGAFVGFEYTGIIDCPSYKNLKDISNVNDESEISALADVPSRGKCWGKLYVDVNGKQGPDLLNNDVFVFGLDAYGVAQ